MTMDGKRQHNLQLPISRLTNEILSKIFCNLRTNFLRTVHWQDGHGRNGWISIAYVCHAWREVALNTPLLWCRIVVLPFYRSWIPELLRRSKQSPLTVVVPWATHAHDLLAEVKTHYGRVRELVLDTPRSDTLQQIFSSQSNLQNLQSLDISTSSNFVLDDSYLHTECLRRLVLRYTSIDWNSKFLHGLTHLSILDVPNGCALGCHDFILILSKIPALETLDLAQFLREEQVQAKAIKICLQHLQQLSVDCEVPEMAQFLACLVVPRSCRLSITTGYTAVCDEFRAILSWVSNQLRVPTTSPTLDHGQCIRTFHLMYTEEVRVQGFCDVLSHEQLETAEPILEFAVRHSADDYYGGSFDSQIFLSLLPLGGVTFLDVFTDEDTHLPPKFWTVAFGSMQTLTTVYLETQTSGFWEALLTPATSDNTTDQSQPIFSALSSVTVEDPSLDSQHVLDKLRVRYELGGTHIQVVEIHDANRKPVAEHDG